MYGSLIPLSNTVRYLGAHLDNTLSFETHITTKCRAALSNLYRIRNIRRFLTREACETLLIATCISHLDYSNSLLCGLPPPPKSIDKLQRVQNFAAKVALSKSKYSSITDALHTLHWLPIRERIIFKIVTLVYKALHGRAPQYLQDLITKLPVTRTLRSNDDTTRLLIPRTKSKTFASRAFSVYGPTQSNLLPADIRESTSGDLFKSRLKTFLFESYFK